MDVNAMSVAVGGASLLETLSREFLRSNTDADEDLVAVAVGAVVGRR